ncbi:unnamed protein product, partial [Ilex paraguariensis]
ERGNKEWVTEGVGVLKRNGAAMDERLAVIDKAIVEAEALEDLRVDEAGGAERATVEVDAGDVTAGGAHVRDLHRICGYAVGKGRCGALVYNDIRF